MSQSPSPLQGVTVIDLTTALAGPYATLILGGLGARIIKVENPAAPDSARGNAPFLGRDGVALTRKYVDDFSLAILERGRNKQSVTLDLKHPAGRQVFFDLVKKADAVVENFSAGVTDRLGIGYSVLRAVNSRIVYTAVSGFGATANLKQNKAMDAIVQAMSGLMMTNGAEGEPPQRVGVPFGDLSAPLFAVIGTLAALMQARATGQGQFVDVSLLGVLSSMVAMEPFDILERLGQPYRTGNFMARLAPFGVFATRDGYIAICAPVENFAIALYAAMGRPELAKDPRFSSRDARVTNHQALHGLVGDWMAAMTTSEAEKILSDCGVPSGTVRGPGEAKRDPLLLARGETMPITHPVYGAVEKDIYGSGMPIIMSASHVGYDQPALAMGASNAAVYGELLGYDKDRLDQLARDKVI